MKKQLIDALVNKVNVSPATSARGQTFLEPDEYLTQPLWDFLGGDTSENQKMAAFTSHLGRLGLINPKEPTVKHCTAKFYLIVRGNACLDLRKEDKCANNAVFKKSLEAFAGGVLGTVVFPRSPHEWRVTEAVRYLEIGRASLAC